MAPRRYVRQRPSPSFGPMKPTRTPPTAAHVRKSVKLSRPMTGATSSMAQAMTTHMIMTRPRLSQPSAGPDASRRIIRPGSRRAVRSGRDDVVRQLVLGEGVPERPDPLRGGLRVRTLGRRLEGRRIERHDHAADAAGTQGRQGADPVGIQRGRDDRPRSCRA